MPRRAANCALGEVVIADAGSDERILGGSQRVDERFSRCPPSSLTCDDWTRLPGRDERWVSAADERGKGLI
jgi:hypothetical protein